ncbi:MAG: universal stress protein [Acidobacteria bacterium]|nr:universal stress protein [Acidobacteriota bacterium]
MGSVPLPVAQSGSTRERLTAFGHLLVPLNGSQLAERAISVAAALAEREGLALELISIVSRRDQRDDRKAYLEIVKATLPFRPISSSVIVSTHAPSAIAAECDEDTMPVMATSGHIYRHDRYVGSAAETVVRASGRPVMLVGAKCDVDHALDVDRVVVPTDGSKKSEEAIPLGLAWARRLGVPLWLVAVIKPDAVVSMRRAVRDDPQSSESSHLRNLAKMITDADDVQIEWEVLHDDNPADAIAGSAIPNSLVVMTTHGRTGLRRIALGSVATRLVRKATRPVIVFRPSGLVDD